MRQKLLAATLATATSALALGVSCGPDRSVQPKGISYKDLDELPSALSTELDAIQSHVTAHCDLLLWPEKADVIRRMIERERSSFSPSELAMLQEELAPLSQAEADSSEHKKAIHSGIQKAQALAATSGWVLTVHPELCLFKHRDQKATPYAFSRDSGVIFWMRPD